MRLSARVGDDASFEAHYSRIAGRTSEPRVARGAGLALFERTRAVNVSLPEGAQQLTRLREQGLALLELALRAEPFDAETAWAYAILAAQLGSDLDGALRVLKRVGSVVTDNPDLAQAAALVHEARGDYAAMLSSLEALERNARELDQRRWARERIQQVRKKPVT